MAGWQVSYAAGVNEKILGDFIRKHNCRDKIFSESLLQLDYRHTLLTVPQVASKCGMAVFEDGRCTNSASHINAYIDGTMERLGFAPDVYYLHRIDPSTSNAMFCFDLGRD